MAAASSLTLRDATDADGDAIWNIFRAVVGSGDTYAFDPDISRTDALAYWMQPPNHCHVAQHHGMVVGTYILKANQPGLGSHVANAAFMVSLDARGLGLGRAMGEHALNEARRLGFIAMQFNFGGGWGFGSSGRCLAPSATRRRAMSTPM